MDVVPTPCYVYNAPMKNGFLILSGGGKTDPECTKTLIRRAGGNDAPIVVFGQAADVPKESGDRSAEWLRENGANTVLVPVVKERADVAGIVEAVTMLRTARGVWIGGGDQTRFMQTFEGTPVLAAIQDVLRRGGAAGGTSAGASLAGTFMPTGEGDRTKLTQNSVETKPGLALWEGIVDSHFLARERMQRLFAMLLSLPNCAGIGIDEGAWVEIDLLSRGKMTAHTGQTVLVRPIPRVRRDGENRLAADDVRVTVLLPGESANLS